MRTNNWKNRMKNSANFLRSFLAVALMAVVLTSCDDEKKIDYSDMPGSAQSFVEQYFNGIDIQSVIREKDDGTTEYHVTLTNGTELEFNKSGDWTSIECHFSTLPDGILLPAISSDIRERHTDARIHGVDKELGGFVVEVNADSTEWDMYYTTEGEFSHESKDTPDYD